MSGTTVDDAAAGGTAVGGTAGGDGVAGDEEVLRWYAEHAPMTQPGPFGDALAAVPHGPSASSTVAALVGAVQNVSLHLHMAPAYGVTLTAERRTESNLRPARDILGRALALDDGPLTVERPFDRRVVGTCRNFTVLLVAALRSHGVPARSRCGFGTYFRPGAFEDHWVAEYWDAARDAWVLVDAQLDLVQRGVLGIDFDPLDVPRDRFVVAGLAWQWCREGRYDAGRFGILDMSGNAFVHDNLVRDVLALTKTELLPWDPWGLMVREDETTPVEDLPLLDRLAELSVAAGGPGVRADVWQELRTVVDAEPRLTTPVPGHDLY